MATRKKAPAKGARRAKAKPASRSGSETRTRSVMLLSVPPGYTDALDAKADAAGMTRSAYVRAAVEAYGGPAASTITVSVDAAMLAALSDCGGVPPGVRARVLLREVLGLWGLPVGEKAEPVIRPVSAYLDSEPLPDGYEPGPRMSGGLRATASKAEPRDDGANCRHCGHYETSHARAEEHYAHCPSCNLHTRWVPVGAKAAE